MTHNRPKRNTHAVVLIRRIDGKVEASFAYRACIVRDTVATLLLACNVCAVAWDGFMSREFAKRFLKDACEKWL